MSNRKFYEYVNRGGGKKVITSLPSKIHKQFATDELEAMYDYIVEKGKTENVFLNPNSRRADLPPGARGSDDDITSVIAFVADVDVLGPAHKEQNLPPTKEAAIDAINEASIKPSVIVDSGYGIYAYYFFENPIDTSDVKKRKYVSSLYRGFGKYLADMFAEKGWKLDPVFNLSHMFRAPGSLNHKLESEKPECRVITDNGIFYSIEDFEPYYIEPVQQSVSFEADAREVGSADRMRAGCAFIQNMVEDPNAITEPEWKAELSNIVLANDGVEKAHEWSSLYDGYSYEETEAKVQQCLKAKKPCTCFYIKNTLGFQCPEGGCGVKAPIVFARYTKAEQLQNWLSKDSVSMEDILEPYAIGLLAYAKDNCPVEYIKVKEVVKKAGMDSFEQLVECLQFMYSWKIRVTDKTVTFSTLDMKKGIRGNKLGEGYGKAELAERIAKVVAERNAEKEARRIAEEETRMKAEALAREEAARKEKQLQEERKQREILSRKRKLGFSRNSVQQDYCNKELAREDWNKDYVDYLQSQFINVNDVAGFTEEELTAPIMNREEFEQQQAVELYREKATRAGELWDMVLKQISGTTHKWKWDYMDYLENIKYKDTADVTLADAKEEILSYEEFAKLREADKKKQEQFSELAEIPVDTNDETREFMVSEDVNDESIEMEEAVSEVVADVAEVIDYSKMSVEERATRLPIPTNDYGAEYDAYCQRMGYTAEKMKSIRYKMTVYDEFMEEYNYRKKYYGVRDNLRGIAVTEKSKGAR